MYAKYVKRPLDFVLSLTALIVLSPLLLILTIVGAIAMKGSPFFVQKRPGRISKKTGQEKIFSLIKFRTMSNAKDKDGNLLPDKDRLNRYGRFLRSTSLDELPELVNIVKGDMAIVGPRPLIPQEEAVHKMREQAGVYQLRPGMTGWAQVNGRDLVEDEEKVKFDRAYLDQIGLKMDIKILCMTFKKVATKADIEEGTVLDDKVKINK